MSLIPLGCWVAAQGFALYLTPMSETSGMQMSSSFNAIVIVAALGVATLVVWFGIKAGLGTLIRAMLMVAVAMLLLHAVFLPLARFTPLLVSLATAAAISGVITLSLLYRPRWYVMDAVGVLVGGSAIAILGSSLDVLSAIALLVVLALYDFIAVNKTKHMITIAESALTHRLPMMLITPQATASSLSLGTQGHTGVVMLGLGDVVIPGVLIVASSAQGWLVALSVFGGALIGLVLLFATARGRPRAGLPWINTGAIAGYVISAGITML